MEINFSLICQCDGDLGPPGLGLALVEDPAPLLVPFLGAFKAFVVITIKTFL